MYEKDEQFVKKGGPKIRMLRRWSKKTLGGHNRHEKNHPKQTIRRPPNWKKGGVKRCVLRSLTVGPLKKYARAHW